jgi:ubiquinone/menaquinone biosynthesis C-methylase UbiE
MISNKPYVVNYDERDYDYTLYWKGRAYENSAEHTVLNKLLNNERGNFFLDIGGSFGRNAPIYATKYTTPIILDYSLATLQKNHQKLQMRYPNMTMIAGNAYNLPFKTNSIDASIMVRTLHHLEKPEKAIKEVARVTSENGIYIQEFANKLHIKARLRWLITGQISNFSRKPYQQPSRGNKEGIKDGDKYVFLNFHIKHILSILRANNFTPQQTIGCSFLRIPTLKKYMSTTQMMAIEKVLQKIPFIRNLAPSIYIKSTYNSSTNHNSNNNGTDIYKILVCPKCKGALKLDNESLLICTECKSKYMRKKGVWDLRY